MKIGILTLQEADNYGAVLQAYALQTHLAELGAESEFIVFQRDASDANRLPNKLNKRFLPIADRILEEGKKRTALFDDFRKSYLNQSVPFSKHNKDQLNNKYDIFITGSDQVWNFELPEVDSRYFLPFARPEKRFSYAASFGTGNISEYVKGCRQYLENFSGISVREDSGRRMIQELIGKDSIVCLDPVFLPGRRVWDKLCRDREKEPYVFLHMNQYTKQLFDQAKKLAEEKGMKLRTATAGFTYPCGFQAWSGIGVTDWLSLIRNAEFIFTNSFHAIAFSMIFGRPFSAVGLEGALAERNLRMVELLERTDMKECMLGKMRSISEQKLEECLEEDRKISHEYLRSIVSGAADRP